MHSHHSHSGQFCKHAVGQLEDVVKAAIDRGFTVYGLTEHAPRYRAQDLYPEESDASIASLDETFRDFIAEARRLQMSYSNEISLLVGVETEYILPSDMDRIQQLINNVGGVDYVVGSVHHVLEIPIDFDEATFNRALAVVSSSRGVAPSDTHAELCALYFDAQYDVVQRLRPAVIGHFDLCRLYRPNFSFVRHPDLMSRIERNVGFAVSYGAVFEANAAAFRKGWSSAYPGADVAEIIIRHGGRFVLSDDSHGPHAVGLNYHKLREYLRHIGVEELWYLARTEDNGGSKRTVPIQVQGNWWEDAFWSKAVW